MQVGQTVLYGLIGYGIYRIWREKEQNKLPHAGNQCDNLDKPGPDYICEVNQFGIYRWVKRSPGDQLAALGGFLPAPLPVPVSR